MLFRAYDVTKMVMEDTWDEGALPDTETEVMHDDIDVEAYSLTILRRQLADHFGLSEDRDSWTFEYHHEDPTRGRLMFQRTETRDGHPPFSADVEKWKAGQKKMWLADYDFSVQAYELVDIPEAEVEKAVIESFRR